MQEIIRNTQGNTHFFIVLIAVLVILAVSSALFSKNTAHLFRDDFNKLSYNNIWFTAGSTFLYVFSVVLYISSIFQKFNFSVKHQLVASNTWNTIGFATLFILGLLIIRFIISILGFYIIGIKTDYSQYGIIAVRYFVLASICFLFFALLIKYAPFSLDFQKTLLYISIIISSILFIYLEINQFLYIRKLSKIPSYYIFLYLCTLEILPLLVIGKYILTQTNL